MFFTKPFDLVTEPKTSGPRKELNTIMFYTFILMNLFNQFNCRLLDTDAEESKKHLNIFTNSIWKSPCFWGVTFFEFFVTMQMIEAGNSELGSALLGTGPISTVQVIICWVLGAFSLVVNIILKFIPMNGFYWVANKVDLEGEGTNETNAVSAVFKNATEQYQRRMSSIVDGPI